MTCFSPDTPRPDLQKWGTPIRLLLRAGLFAHLLGGCAGASDAERYATALQRSDAATCGRIRAAATRAECLSAVAVARARAHDADGATAACARQAVGNWRDECYFSLSDELGRIGQEALQTCAQAGRYQQDCIHHAAAREVEQRLLSQGGGHHGREREVGQRMVGILRGYMGEGEAQRMAHSMTISWLARRDDGQVFRPQSCGNLDANLCAQVYILRARSGALQTRPDAPWLAHCGAELTPQIAAQDAELPEFSPEMAPLVQQAWTVLCGRG